MKLHAKQTDERSLSRLGEEASTLLIQRDYSGLVSRFGYALARDREPATALEADYLRATASPLEGKRKDTMVKVKYFEPNDAGLWGRIRRTITAFLVLEWRAGALFGASPTEAFFVKCDEETNTAESIDAGQVICEIGVAPVKPAEFVVFRLSQYSGGAALVE